jgi:putative N-acetylmannosamine-6-phosphate epimerase
MSAVLERLRGGLIVSCQPVVGGPLDDLPFVRAFALAAVAGGAVSLRIEGAANVAAVVAVVPVPVIGLIKRDLAASPARITPLVEDVDALIAAGAAIVAVDATDRPRPVPVAALIERIRRAGSPAMADVATDAEGRAAARAGADLLASTLAGYTGDGPPPETPDLGLVARLAAIGLPVIAEGNLRTPEQAAAALRAGAFAVCVGSAITRPELITEWFVRALRSAGGDAH